MKDLVAENNRRYADDISRFLHFDILKDQEPEADVWLCRDVLLHLSNELIFGFLRNFSASRVPYLLTSTYRRFPENLDIPTGTGRPVNLEIAPFCLPAPIDVIEDDARSNRPKRLGLWDRSAIAALDWV